YKKALDIFKEALEIFLLSLGPNDSNVTTLAKYIHEVCIQLEKQELLKNYPSYEIEENGIDFAREWNLISNVIVNMDPYKT
ncbi:unnamed protein product, partial [Didymodactylos carnosus]